MSITDTPPQQRAASLSATPQAPSSSAIASKLAQGEASWQRAASPQAAIAAPEHQALPAAAPTFASASIHDSAVNGAIEHTSVSQTTAASESTQSHSEQAPLETVLPVDDRAASTGAVLEPEASITSSTSVVVAQATFTTATPTINGHEASNGALDKLEDVFYAPMSDSEPEEAEEEEAAEVQRSIMTATVVQPVDVAAAVTATMQDEDMLRSPSVSYVDPVEDLALEQDRANMMDLDNTPGYTEARASAGPTLNERNDLPRKQTTPEYLEGPFSQPRGSRPPSSSPTQEPNGFLLDPGTPASPGWGILGQHTPAADDEEDEEIDELGEPSPRKETPEASGSRSQTVRNVVAHRETASANPSTPDKGKQKARDQDEFPQIAAADSMPPPNRKSDVPASRIDDQGETPVSPRRAEKGKSREVPMRDTTPVASGSQARHGSRNPGTPSTVARASPKIARPAAPRRKYRGLERFKGAACLALNRADAYLDVALHDENKTCWIRCVNWDVDGDTAGAGESSDDSDTVHVAARAAGTAAPSRRARQRHLQSAVQQSRSSSSGQIGDPAGPTERLFQKIRCKAEVLGELVEDDPIGDKWRVTRVEDQHSTACTMLIRQVMANELMQAAEIGIDVENDPEVAEDILAAQLQSQADEMDPELTFAIQQSLEEAKRMEEKEDFSTLFPEDDAGGVYQPQQMDWYENGPYEQQTEPAADSSDTRESIPTASPSIPPLGEPSSSQIPNPTIGDIPSDFPDIPTFEDHAPRGIATEERPQSEERAPTTHSEQGNVASASGPAPGLFRRLLNSVVPGRAQTSEPDAAHGHLSASASTSVSAVPTTSTVRERPVAAAARCWTGDTFKTKKDYLSAAAAVLSLGDEEVKVRYGKRYTVPFITVSCPNHKDLKSDPTAPTGAECEAQVTAYQKDLTDTWTVGNLVARHAPSCHIAHKPAPQETTASHATGAVQTNGFARSVALESRQHSSASSASTDHFRPTPIISKLMTFETSAELKETAAKALARDLSDLEVKEVPHPVSANQMTLNLYCKNYAFAQSNTTARGWSAIPQRLGLGGGNQAAKCMAFVEALKKRDDEPWRIGNCKLEHGARCQTDFEQAQSGPKASASDEVVSDKSSASGSQRRNKPSRMPRGPLITMQASASSSSSRAGSSNSASRPAVPSRLQSAAPILDRTNNASRAPDAQSDEDIEFVGEKEGPPPPVIDIGASYKPNDLAKLAQKLSTYWNKGSEVVWTQKPGNAPRSLACKHAPGYNRDTTSDVTCNFRITAKYAHQTRTLQVESVLGEHSPACMVAHGNRPVDRKPERPSTASRGVAARKTGSSTALQGDAYNDTSVNEPTQSQPPGRYAARMPWESESDQPFEAAQAESSQAAQRRAANSNAQPAASQTSRKRTRDAESSTSRSKTKITRQGKAPPKPIAGRIYNSVSHFINEVKAYSKFKSPFAELRRIDAMVPEPGHGRKSKNKTHTTRLMCMFDGCAFQCAGLTLQDAAGRELEGFQIKEDNIKHSSECRHADPPKRKGRNTASQSNSVIDVESSAPSEDQSDEDALPGNKRKAKQSKASSSKRRRIESSEESAASLPPPLSTKQKSPEKRRRLPTPETSGNELSSPPEAEPSNLPEERDRSPSIRGGTPAVATQAAPVGDEEFFASFRNIIKQEQQSPGRPERHVKLYTGQIYDSRDAFVDAVLHHTEERNPGCRLAVANTDPARVRVYCMRADCPYSFNSVYEHGARRIPAVKVTANHRDHSAGCLAYYRAINQDEQRVHFDPPQVDQDIGDWHDFESAVQAHTESVNPGCELKTTKTGEHLRVYCPHKDLGCKYSFRAKFDIAEIQEGRVKVINARTEHSQGCLDHHTRIAEEEAEEEEALNPGVARKFTRLAGSSSDSNGRGVAPQPRVHQGPGPHPGDLFENEAAFREAVEKHTQLVNPGSSLQFRKPNVNNLQFDCRNYHTGCRYEFYAALHPPAPDGSRRFTVTDVTPDHHEMCVAELVLRGRRSAPDDGAPIRTRRGRASLAALNPQGSQGSQAGTSINGSTTKIVARKTTQSQKSALAKSRLRESDEDSDAVPLRESNLMSHTSMSSLRQADAEAPGPARSGRPPLIPPSQQARGRPSLVPANAAPARPIKRTRFENVEASSSDSSKAPAAEASIPEAQPATRPAGPAFSTGGVGLAGILSAHATKVLASLGYHTVSDLSGIGVSREDWPDLNAFLASCTVEQFERLGSTHPGSLDPLQKFLIHRRARIAFIDESNGYYLAPREIDSNRTES